MVKAQILEFDRRIRAWHRSTEPSWRLMKYPASVRCWPLLWSLPLPTPRRSGQAATSRPGSGWCRSRTRAAARRGLAISASKVTAICAACSGRRAGRHPLCQNPWHQASALAHGVAGAAAHQGRGHRARQQDRQDGLGDDGQGERYREPAGSRPNEITPGIRRDVRLGGRTARNAEPVDPAIRKTHWAIAL